MIDRNSDVYLQAIARLAPIIQAAKPAIEPGDEAPRFNVVNCAAVLGAALGVDPSLIETDLHASAFGAPARARSRRGAR